MTRSCTASTLVFMVLSLSTPAGAAPYDEEVKADQPFVYYRFEEESGTQVVDSSGRGLHGEYVDGVELNQPSATDALGRSALFDGDTGYVQMPILDLESPQLTIETWIHLESLAPSGCCTSIFSPDGWDLGWLHYNLRGDANIEFALNGGGPNNHNTDPDTVPFEEWTHIASVYDADEAIVQTYVDGVQVDVFPEDFGTPPEVALIVEAQVAAWQSTRFLGGLLDEFAIYDSALSQERILAHFQAAIGEVLPGDYNNDGVVNADDVDDQSAAMKDPDPDLAVFDENDDLVVNEDDRLIWVHTHAGTWVGDANLDGEFNSSDFVDVFVAGQYETGNMAGWAQGDWDGNMLFDSGDFVAAFTDGGYELGPQNNPLAVPEPSTSAMLAIGLLTAAGLRRRPRQR